MPPPVRFRRHFLPWDRPWLPQVAAWLAQGWNRAGPLDLSSVLAIVPTRQSGRRLREALAEYAAQHGTAVFPPRTHTPDTLLAPAIAGGEVASRLEALLAWAQVLREVDLDTVAAVFPVAPPRRDFAWAWRLAGNLHRLQTQLNEAGLAFGDVARRAGSEFSEAERWQQLAALEDLQAAALATHGLREPHAARRAFVGAPALPAGIARIVLLAAPDPLAPAVAVLETWAETIPVEVVVFAPAAEADAFDPIGRPRPAAWEQRPIVLPEFEQRVHVCADPTDEAQRAAKVVRVYPAPDGCVGLGVADPEGLPLLENELSRLGIAHFNPDGRTRRTERLYALLSALAALTREASMDAVAALAACPDFLSHLRDRFGSKFSVATFLAELDTLRATHLPADLPAARAFVNERSDHLARGLAAVVDLRATLAGTDFPANAVAALTLLFGSRRFDLKRPDEADAAAAIGAWRDVMRQCAAAHRLFPDLKATDWWDVALPLYGEGRREEDKPAAALDLQGWLELAWEDAPHLVVIGLNDGLVPDAIVGDPFLPETLRETLGLKTNAARFARDAYLLQAIASSRAPHGRLELFLAKTSAAGDPLRPSRLLLRCEDEELPERIAYLFRSMDTVHPHLPWTRAWQLAPRRVPPPSRVSVTGLRTWLACPFRFYLAHVLRLEPVDAEKTEMDARDFGTLCHHALEAMARDLGLRECREEGPLREFLLMELDRAVLARFGEQLTLPLMVQLESARQRLGKMAALQARQRADGWVIRRAEWTFTLDVGGLEIRGKIDRMDEHEKTGAWRVLDYKTSDTAVPPHKSHVRPFRAGDTGVPAWMRGAWNGREFVWADLQLPLYLRALAAEFPDAGNLDCGYINLPKAAGETAVALWSELTPQLLAAAHACTDGVAAKIRAGEFWPPAEMDPERDAFGSLFQHGAAESVAWEAGG